MLGRIALISCAACGLAIACSSPTRSVDDDDDASSTGSGTNGSGTTSTSSGGASGSGASGAATTTGSGGGGGSAQPSYPICLATCTAPIECAQGTPAFDEDNYSCDDGHCTYLGCNSDIECEAQGNLVCRSAFDPLMLGGSMICVFACSSPADCDYGAGPAWDADNYACVDGGCQYQGCNSEAECQGQTGNLTCRDTGAGVAYCQTACSIPADCAIGGGAAYDADNYACDAGVCVYQGCNSVAECMSLGDYTCVTP
jgi:hypothetical protein